MKKSPKSLPSRTAPTLLQVRCRQQLDGQVISLCPINTRALQQKPNVLALQRHCILLADKSNSCGVHLKRKATIIYLLATHLLHCYTTCTCSTSDIFGARSRETWLSTLSGTASRATSCPVFDLLKLYSGSIQRTKVLKVKFSGNLLDIK